MNSEWHARIRGIFVAAGCLVLVAGAAAAWSFARVTADHAWAGRACEILDALGDLSRSVLEVETGVGRFLSSGEPRYLAPYRAARTRLADEMRRARALTAADPDQQRRLSTVESLMARRLAVAAETVRIRTEQGREALPAARLEEGRATTDEIRAQVAGMLATHSTLLRERLERAGASTRRTLVVVGLDSALVLGVLVLAARVVRRDTRHRQQAEEALRRAEAHYRLLFDRSFTGLVRTGQGGRIVECNTAFAQICGHASREEMVGLPAGRLYADPADRADVVRRMAAGERVADHEVRLRRQDGRVVWVALSAVLVRDGAAVHVDATVVDVTARRAAADRLVRIIEAEGQLKQLGRVLDACHTADEVYEAARRNLGRLLPARAGTLYVLNASRNLLESGAAWGEIGEDAPVFGPDECWALRRGHPHRSSPDSAVPECGHHRAASAPSLCLPLVAQGETVGLLSLQRPATPDGSRLDAEGLELATAVGDKLALTLANLSLRERLRHQSVRDPLTGLFNRRYIEETLTREVDRARREGIPVALLMLDVDHFKRFNDTFGHDAADVVLCELGSLLRGRVRAEDVPGRLGGEEFSVLLPGAGVEVALQRAEDIRAAVKALRVTHNEHVLGEVTLSVGVAAYPQHGTDVATLVRSADRALYAAKHAGRDRVMSAAAAWL